MRTSNQSRSLTAESIFFVGLKSKCSAAKCRLAVWTTEYLRRRGGKCRHPRLEKPQPKSERVFADENKIDELEDGELVEEDPSDDRHDEVAQLRHDQHQILDAQNLGADDTADSDG